MGTPNDDLVAPILADMRDSQAPAISPMKSPTKRASSHSEEETPASQRPPQLTTEQNPLPGDETRQS